MSAPTYDRALITDSPPGLRIWAIEEAVKRSDTDAIEHLLRALDSTDFGLVHPIFEFHHYVAAHAMVALAKLGHSDAAFVQRLWGITENLDVHMDIDSAAYAALVILHQISLEDLRQRLWVGEDQSEYNKFCFLDVCRKLDVDGEMFLAILNDSREDERVRQWAGLCLEMMGYQVERRWFSRKLRIVSRRQRYASPRQPPPRA